MLREVRAIHGHLVLLSPSHPMCMKCGWSKFEVGPPEPVLEALKDIPCTGTVLKALAMAAGCVDQLDLERQILTLVEGGP